VSVREGVSTQVCLHCRAPRVRVLETRRDGTTTWRRLRCGACKGTFVSREEASLRLKMPTKFAGGRFEAFKQAGGVMGPRVRKVPDPPPSLPGEEWYPIPRFLGDYAVSTAGRVRSEVKRDPSTPGRGWGGKILKTYHTKEVGDRIIIRAAYHKVNTLLAEALVERNRRGLKIGNGINANSISPDRTGE